MNEFPRTMVGGVSLPRLLIGSNWLLGYSHTSLAKDRFIKDFQTRERIAKILVAFLERGVDAVMAGPTQLLEEAILDAEDQTGRAMIRILTPIFNVVPGGDPEREPEVMMDLCKKLNATFCMPHQAVTDALVDRTVGKIRDIERYTKMIRERGIVLEVCPTSNLNTRVVSGWDELRWIFDTFRRNEIRFAISTDGPEMLKTYIRDELATLGRLGILTVDEQLEVARTGMRASFVPNVSDIPMPRLEPAPRDVVEREEA